MTEETKNEEVIKNPETMYQEIEQDEYTPKGCIATIELIVYDVAEKKPDGTQIFKHRGIYFCQTDEQKQIFEANNPGAKIESFNLQLEKSTAIKYLDNPENIKQFTKKE